MMNRFDIFYQSMLTAIKDATEDKYVEILALENDEDDKMELKHSTIKDSLKTLADEWKEVHPTIEVEECSNISKCTMANRVKLLLHKFNQYFLTKYIYNDNNVGKVDQIDFVDDIFMSIFMKNGGYKAVDLLNDWEHIKANHLESNQD